MQKTIDEIKAMPIWMLWKKRPRGTQMSKIPIAANGKTCGTSENYADRWVTFDAAQQAAAERRADGIGFRIPNGMFFLDIDHRDLKDPFVQEIMTLYKSYSEFSVSGQGIHIYGLCDISQLPTYIDPKDGKQKLSKDYYMHHPDNGLELYFGELTSRFAVFTENTIENLPLMDCTAAIQDTLERYMRKKPAAQSPLDKKADDTIAKLRSQKNGDYFSELFDYGLVNGTSHSEADAALCALIAFRTGDNPELIDAIFRKSALYRPEKWDREDYRTITIKRAIAWRERNKGKQKKVPKQPDFVLVDSKGHQSVSAPLLARHVRKHLNYVLVRDSATQGVLKYVYRGGAYVLYDQNMLYGAIKQFIADYDESLVKMTVVKEVAQLILSDLNYLSQDNLNANEDLINFQNGLLRVSGNSVKLLPHSPEVLSTIQIPCKWTDHEIPTPVFDSFLDTLTDGDPEIKQLLLEVMGVAISNVKGWRTKKALFLVGDGNTGKSQLKSLTERLLGKNNYIGMDLSEIEARFGTGSLYGKRLAGSSDMSFLSVDELKVFKKLTGGDDVHMEFKGQQAFSATFTGILWFCTNKLPRFSGDKGAWLYSRIVPVYCPNVIPPEKQDKQLLDKMYAEREGIVQKCVKALQTVIANGYKFSEPESVITAREQYQAINSTVISFFEDCMCPWPNGSIGGSTITTGKIHKAYLLWCRENNNGYSKPAKEFREELATHLHTTFSDMTTRIHGNTYYKEWTLTKDAQQDYIK